jgi:extracellular factor (EF) 3-hydroxypalmitic acid methyl ester biosynthesis protein
LWSREIISLIEEQFAEYFHSQLKQMFEAVRHLDESYREQLRQYAQFHLHSLFEHAPIFHRSYHKPSGYAGDYTIMVMMYFAENHYWGDTLFGKLMHRMGCSLTASKAAISRIAYLTRNIQKRLDEYRGQDPMRIFSLACGPGKELADLLRYNQRSSKALELTLFDQDSEALTYCHSIFTPLRTQLPNVKINYTKSAIRQLITEREYLESLPKQDIITSTGLFDYLKDRTASLLLSNLVELLRPGGTLLIGNLDVTCDTKVVFDNLLDWYMIYRSKEDLLRLASTITQPVDFHIEAEDTGINLFLVVRKKNSGI